MNKNTFVSIEAEQATLGALFLNPAKFDDVRELIGPDDFANLKNQNIFESLCGLSSNGQPIDLITVCEDLVARGLEADHKYIATMIENATSSVNVQAYAHVVREHATKRLIFLATANTIRHITDNPDLTASQAIDYAQSKIMGLGNDTTENGVTQLKEALKTYIEHLDYLHQKGDAIDGLTTLWGDVDNRVDGYKPGNLVIIAARPGQGKTTIALNMAYNFSGIQRKHGMFISLEMGSNELMQRFIACAGSIPQKHLKKPAVAGDEFWGKLSSTVARCKDAPLNIVDLSSLHINQLKSYVRKVHKRKPLDYIMVDYIGLMSGDGANKNLEIGSISRGCKQLAKELGITSFVLAQLNRDVEKRVNKRPTLADLRDSGEIEQDADIVHFLYRDEYYNPDTPNPNTMELITAKFRNGEIGTDYLKSEMYLSKIGNLEGGYQEYVNKKSMSDRL